MGWKKCLEKFSENDIVTFFALLAFLGMAFPMVWTMNARDRIQRKLEQLHLNNQRED